MEKHRALHQMIRQFSIAEPKNWTVGSQVKAIQGGEGYQAIVSPSQKDGAESDSALITDSLSAESVVSVTESLLEHPSGE